jgi:hypothetical protein
MTDRKYALDRLRDIGAYLVPILHTPLYSHLSNLNRFKINKKIFIVKRLSFFQDIAVCMGR